MPSDAELQPLAMAELVNAVTANNNAQMKKMMEMFNKQPSGTTARATNSYQQCRHCKLCHVKHKDCWELKKNASKRPKNWKECKKKTRRLRDGDVRRRSHLSISGGREKLKSIS